MKPSARKFPGAGFVIFVRNVYLYPAKIKKNMTKLSVNINKIATLRNSRGGDIPNVWRQRSMRNGSVHRASPCIRVPTSGTSATRMSAT